EHVRDRARHAAGRERHLRAHTQPPARPGDDRRGPGRRRRGAEPRARERSRARVVSDASTSDGHDAPIDATIREATVQGVRWTSLVRLGTEILALASMVVLTHLISPAEFGAVAVVMIVNEVANGLAGTGYGAPLVQRETITRRHVEAVAALSIAT